MWFVSPFDTLAAAIKREFKEERVKANPNLRVSTKRIIDYLTNIADEEGRIPVDLSDVEVKSDDEILHSVASVQMSGAVEELEGGSKSNARTRRVSISDLMGDGLCQEGDNWKFEYKGEVFWARVTGNGELEVKGETYTNPSKAGTAITGKPCGGWVTWQFKDTKGDWHEIEALRRQYRERHGLAAIKWGKKKGEVAKPATSDKGPKAS